MTRLELCSPEQESQVQRASTRKNVICFVWKLEELHEVYFSGLEAHFTASSVAFQDPEILESLGHAQRIENASSLQFGSSLSCTLTTPLVYQDRGVSSQFGGGVAV